MKLEVVKLSTKGVTPGLDKMYTYLFLFCDGVSATMVLRLERVGLAGVPAALAPELDLRFYEQNVSNEQFLRVFLFQVILIRALQ